MKTLALVAALMLGTAAVAQDAPSQPAGDMSAMPPANTGATGPDSAATEPMAQTQAPAPDTGATPDANSAPPAQPMTQPMDSSTGSGMSGGNMSGGNMSNATGMQNMSAPPSSYPLCSRTVKDRCRNRGGK